VVPLSYDDLPPGSDIRRERDEASGVVRIIVPAGEPPAHALWQARRDALGWGALASVPYLLIAVAFLYFISRVRRIGGWDLQFAWGFFTVFCGALVLLAAAGRGGDLTDALRVGRQQATVIAVSTTRLLIETSGPFGNASYDLAADEVRNVTVGRSRLFDDRAKSRRLDHLTLVLADGRAIPLLPGRERAELAAVAGILNQILKQPTPREFGQRTV
jgi:hypothetical protein